MAQFIVETTPEEQQAVLEAVRQLEGATVPVSKIAKLAKLSPSRTRYVILDLIDAEKIDRIPVKAFNEHYIRYTYKIT